MDMGAEYSVRNAPGIIDENVGEEVSFAKGRCSFAIQAQDTHGYFTNTPRARITLQSPLTKPKYLGLYIFTLVMC
jgi:hypothetical protein